jgi:hypothetical protein
MAVDMAVAVARVALVAGAMGLVDRAVLADLLADKRYPRTKRVTSGSCPTWRLQ